MPNIPNSKLNLTVQAWRWPCFDSLRDETLVRQAQLVRNPKNPGEPVPLPFSASSLWRRVADKTFLTHIKVSSNTTCWRVADVHAWLAAVQKGGEA